VRKFIAQNQPLDVVDRGKLSLNLAPSVPIAPRLHQRQTGPPRYHRFAILDGSTAHSGGI
jgi:hypothetical protein